MKKSIIVITCLLLAGAAIWIWVITRPTEIVLTVSLLGEDGMRVANVLVAAQSDSGMTNRMGETTLSVWVREGDSLEIRTASKDSVVRRWVFITSEDVEEESKDVLVQLVSPPAKFGWLEVTSPESNVKVFINDEYRGDTPFSESLIPGEYAIKGTKDGYREKTVTVSVADKETTRQALELDKIGPIIPYWNVRIESTPSGARITIDGSPLATPAPLSRAIRQGSHRIVATLLDETQTRDVLVDHQGIVVSFRFREPTQKGTLRMESIPPGMKIIVDMKGAEERTDTDLPLDVGEHNIEVVFPNGVWKQKVLIEGGITVVRVASIGGECVTEAISALEKGKVSRAFELVKSCDTLSFDIESKRKYSLVFAQVLIAMQRFEDAGEILKGFLLLNPNESHGYYLLGNVLENQHEYRDAIDNYLEVEKNRIKIPQKDRPQILGEAAFSIGYCWYMLWLGESDLERKREYAKTAQSEFQEFKQVYCKGSAPHNKCERASNLLLQLEER